MNPISHPKLSRREAIALVSAAASTIASLNFQSFGASPDASKPYGTDPLLNKNYKPGDFWPLTLSPSQRKTVATLADLILPADDKSPAASDVGVVEFIDEWISAPYPIQQSDRTQILNGLAWLDQEAQRRFSTAFASLNPAQQSQIADDIAFLAKGTRPELAAPSAFFAKFRNIAAGGFYATRQGMKDIGYVGNVVLARFDGPSKSIRDRLGV